MFIAAFYSHNGLNSVIAGIVDEISNFELPDLFVL
jgi:hypothetical protein